MKKIIACLAGLSLIAATEAADLNVKLAPQATNYGNAVHTELTLSDFYGKGIVEAGLEKDLGNEKMPNFKAQLVHFLPKDFSANALVRIGTDDHFNPNEFVYVAVGPGHSFARGKVNTNLSAQANVPIKDGRFGNPELGISAYVDYELAKGLKLYAVGSASKGFQLARVGVNAAFPKLYKK